MKRTLLIYPVLAMLVAGCSGDIDLAEPLNGGDQEEEAVQLPKRNLDEAVFHEGAGGWMVPQKDPYTLANFRQAHANLLSGKSAQTLTRAQADELASAPELKATHYALRIFPKTEEEQWKIELMEDVNVVYMPFDYVQLSQEEVEKLPTTKTRSGANGEPEASEASKFPESYRYTVTYTDLETPDGPIPDRTYILPILYAVWPIDKPLPDDIEHEVDYEVFLPDYEAAETRVSTGEALGVITLMALENEAISIASGIPVQKIAAGTRAIVVNMRNISGVIKCYDGLLKAEVPQSNLKQQIQNGSNIHSTYTDANGYFSFKNSSYIIPLISSNATYSHVFQHPKWKITPEGSTAPITIACTKVGQRWPDYGGDMHINYKDLTQPEYVVSLAVDYYYHGNHSIPRAGYDSGIRIRMMNNSSFDADGTFTYSEDRVSEIWIYNNHLSVNILIGLVLHELGHFSHYAMWGGSYRRYHDVYKLLHESYASFVGWHIGLKYYEKFGYIEDPARNITGQSNNNTWRITSAGKLGWYSPLFVDLVDDFNQRERFINDNMPNDNVKNVPIPIINTIAKECSTWGSVRARLFQYVEDTGGGMSDILRMQKIIHDYDWWFDNN